MFLIRDTPYKERPRERFLHYGREALSLQELLAILLRTGTHNGGVMALASEVLKEYPSIRRLSQCDVEELKRFKGLGEAKAIQILGAIELGRRLFEESFGTPSMLTDPKRVYNYMRPLLESRMQEVFYALYLNTKGALIKKQKLFVGSLSSAIVHPREVFKHAVTLSAASVILVHNHPSGNPEPSRSDIEITKIMVRNGKMMDINVFDHVIIGHDAYFSLRQKGLGFERQ